MKKINITSDEIKKIVSSYFNITTKDMDGDTREHVFLKPRQISSFFCYNGTSLSLSTVGLLNGNKDHATVLHSIKTVNNLFDTEITYRSNLCSMIEIIINKAYEKDWQSTLEKYDKNERLSKIKESEIISTIEKAVLELLISKQCHSKNKAAKNKLSTVIDCMFDISITDSKKRLTKIHDSL